MFVARFSHPTGDRLTRYRSTVTEYPTAEAAIAAIDAPFTAKIVSAEAVEIFDNQPGKCRQLAIRRNGKKLVRR